MGEDRAEHTREVTALRQALEIGYRLFDTAEMYGEGGAERVVGEALAPLLARGSVAREDITLVSKVYPHNASRRGAVAACERSLKRLRVESIDIYLLHWRGSIALAETVDAFESLKTQGKIRDWGVSNFDVGDMQELASLRSPALHCATNQIYYSVTSRGPEHSLLPLLRECRIPVMAYSPVDQGEVQRWPILAEIGARHGASATQVALAWLLAQPGVIVIPKAVQEPHLRQNWEAMSLPLSAADMSAIEHAFPAPRRKEPLAMR